MKDLIGAILGERYCGWCTEIGPTVVDRLCRFDQPVPPDEHYWYENAVWRINQFWTFTVPIWKLGRRWHFNHHRKAAL